VAAFRRSYPETSVELVGFHGHTILHARNSVDMADRRRSTARAAGRGRCRRRFRSADVAAGGQARHWHSLYHAALAAALEKPVAVLNLGGVGNVTWIGAGYRSNLAFDTGPGNALIDDSVRRHTGQAADFDGMLALSGDGLGACVARFLAATYFDRKPPKSLDRDDFQAFLPAGLSVADGPRR
jgi:anhydro-N-acetylmuramic acid kinase